MPIPAPSPSELINPRWLERALDQDYRIKHLLVRTNWLYEFEGVHTTLGRKVSIRVLRRAHVNDEAAKRRFLRTVKTGASLYNAHVPSTLATGVLETGQPYVITQLITGTPLLEWMTERGGRLEWPEATSFAFQLCSPVADLHTLQLVSRGVQPESVWITQYAGREPMVKLNDFRHASNDCQVPQSHPLSLAYARPTYQAPEARPEARQPIDCRADAWALGCLLFEMMIGRPPSTVAWAHGLPGEQGCFEEYAAARVPEAVTRVLARCLKPNPEDRYRNARDLAQALFNAQGVSTIRRCG